MKKINFAKLVWVSSIFIILIILLYLVMDYKINYEYLVHNYLYFYECDTNLCVSQVKEKDKLVFSKFDCGYEECPQYLKKIGDNHLILKKGDKHILYDYRKSKVVSDEYNDYELLNSNYIIAKFGGKKGIITVDGKVVVAMIYDEIGYKKDDKIVGYNLNSVIVKKDNLYGIVSYKDEKIVDEIKYSENDINVLLDKIKNKN